MASASSAQVLHNSTVNMTGEHGSSSHNFTGLVSDSFNGTSGSGGLVLTLFADSVVPAGAQVSTTLLSRPWPNSLQGNQHMESPYE